MSRYLLLIVFAFMACVAYSQDTPIKWYLTYTKFTKTFTIVYEDRITVLNLKNPTIKNRTDGISSLKSEVDRNPDGIVKIHMAENKTKSNLKVIYADGQEIIWQWTKKKTFTER